jgi:nucleoside-diphosphate-sugar epimerase
MLRKHSPRILVTGASGFVGGNFVRLALAAGFEVVAQYNRNAPALSSGPNLTLVQCDLSRDTPNWPRVDMVIHAATNANADYVCASDLVDGNTILTRNLKNWMLRAGVPFCFFCSSISVFGEVHTPLLDENTPRINTKSYGMTKLLSEEILRESEGKLRCLAVRLPSVLGPNARGTWLTRTAKALLRLETISIYDAASPFNNAVHVDDLFDLACANLAEGPAGFDFVTVAAAGELSVQNAVETLAHHLGVPVELRIERCEKPSFCISYARAYSKYGYKPMHIAEMLKRYAQAVRQTVA